MTHEAALIATLAVGLSFAFVCGYVAVRLRLPPLVGYLVAGVVVGPFTPGFIADQHLAPQLAEIGVILLMFGVGMHFSLRDLLAVRRIAVPGAIAQIVAATAMTVGVASLWGWSIGTGLVFGLALSVASTVVLLRALENRGRLKTDDGRIAVGWLIVEDLVMVLALVLLPALAHLLGGSGATLGAGTDGASPAGATPGEMVSTLGLALGKVAAFIALMLVVGTRLFPWLLRKVAVTGSRELFTLAIIALALGIAFGSAMLFEVSFALGAFFAGMVLNESDLGHRASRNMQSLQDIFAALFFVSVGMLFDPWILVRQPVQVVAVFLIIVVGKSLAAFGIVLGLGHPMRTALTVSAALAQIGEFSFVLAGLGTGLGLLPPDASSLIVAGALLSITFNPFVFYCVERWAAIPPPPSR